MSREAVKTDKAPEAIGPYSQGISSGPLVFVSGQIALVDGEVKGNIAEQTERALKGLEAILEASGLSLKNVVKTTVYMTDLSEFPRMNEVYARFFEQPFPARAAVGVSALPKGASVEIEAVASR